MIKFIIHSLGYSFIRINGGTLYWKEAFAFHMVPFLCYSFLFRKSFVPFRKFLSHAYDLSAFYTFFLVKFSISGLICFPWSNGSWTVCDMRDKNLVHSALFEDALFFRKCILFLFIYHVGFVQHGNRSVGLYVSSQFYCIDQCFAFSCQHVYYYLT